MLEWKVGRSVTKEGFQSDFEVMLQFIREEKGEQTMVTWVYVIRFYKWDFARGDEEGVATTLQHDLNVGGVDVMRGVQVVGG